VAAAGDRRVPRRPVGLAGRGVHYAADAVPARSRDDVVCTQYVGLQVGLGSLVAVRDPNQRGQVEHRVNARDRVEDLATVANVPGEQADFVDAIGKESRVAVGLVVGQDAHFGAGGEQQVDQRASDEPLTAGDQHPPSGPERAHTDTRVLRAAVDATG